VRASFELICFDLDGTLVDSAPDICHALGAGLAAVGLAAPTEQHTRSWIGDGIEKLLMRALGHAGTSDPEIFSRALTAFHQTYSRNLYIRSRLYPAVENVLQDLNEDGYRLGCITNKRSDYAAALLEQAGILHRFELVFGGDSFAEKKPHPRQLLEAANHVRIAPRSCVMIGDSDTDSSAAATAGFSFIWASFGYCGMLQSRDISTTAQVAQFADIPATLATMMP
jgi:phosphoglycolate phosphatase